MKNCFLLFFLLFIPGFLAAQDVSDYSYFMGQSGMKSNVYRGEIAFRYPFKYEGTYYAYQEEYEKGDVVYNQKTYSGLLLNLNSHIDELCVQAYDEIVATYLKKELVSSFTLGNKEFVHLTLPEYNGYFQVLYRGDVIIYKKIKKNYMEEVDQSVLGSNMMLERVFNPINKYYLVRDNVFYSIDTKRQFLQCFSNTAEKRSAKRFLSTRGVSFRKDKDLYIDLFMQHMKETN